MVDLSPDGKRAYLTNYGPGSLTILDLSTDKVVKEIPLGEGAEGLDVSADGTEVYATAAGQNHLVKLDATSGEELGRVETGEYPVRVLLDGKGHALVNCAMAGKVQVFRCQDLTLFKEIEVGQVPIGLYVGPDKAYSVCMSDAEVAVIALKTWEVSERLPTGRNPDGVVLVK